MSEPKRIVSWSGGKDSTATVILAHENGIPIDEIVMACLWFDKARGISAITPEHWKFITEVAKPKFEKWGYKVTFVDGKKDYIELFNHRLTKATSKYSRVGQKRGWLIAGLCEMTREKQDALRKKQKELGEHISLQGIAVDEPYRLERMHKRGSNQISLLEEFGITEEVAFKLCENYGLLSPIYRTGNRDGCWFCPNCKIKELAYLKRNYPDLWHELEILAEEKDLATYVFKYGKTFAQVNAEVDRYIHRPIQCSLFE